MKTNNLDRIIFDCLRVLTYPEHYPKLIYRNSKYDKYGSLEFDIDTRGIISHHVICEHSQVDDLLKFIQALKHNHIPKPNRFSLLEDVEHGIFYAAVLPIHPIFSINQPSLIEISEASYRALDMLLKESK